MVFLFSWLNKLWVLIKKHTLFYPTPLLLNYSWSFGFLSLMCLINQIITGLLLSMHYIPHVDMAFASVQHIMRDVNNGWLIRYMHSNGASFFFIAVYAHIARGLYYRSYLINTKAWVIGVIMLLLLFATAFIGYVLPWGQMSYWGATVITNLFSAIPLAGQDIVYWLWGGFSVANATLNRFYSLHFFLPFILLALTVLHIFYLHIEGSSNSLGLDTTEWTNFYPYFFLKDLFSLFFFSIPYFYMVFFHPNYLSHPDNFIEANPLVTPTHIVPEWYFLPFYAILRSIPDKLGGVLCMVAAILILLILPIVDNSFVLSMEYYPFSEFSFYMFICSVFVLGWLGTQPIEPPFIELGQQYTVFYFSYFLLLIPGFSRIENWLWFGNSKKSSDWMLSNLKTSNSIKNFSAKLN